MREKTFDEMLDNICHTLDTSSEPKAAYTLLLGAGFSYGVVPTSRQILEDAPQWLHKRKKSGDTLEKGEIIKAFWRNVANKYVAKDKIHNIKFNDEKDFPTNESISAAYQLLMSPDCPGGLINADLRRSYMRHICKNDAKKNNPSHLFLACLLNKQKKMETNWKYPAPFCKTILTTNFDPLLQDALQRVNVLYYMSDRPEVMGFLQEDDHEAIHLVYAHGSIHRYILLNSSAEIEKAKQNNSKSLTTHFERHGIIVIGYAGWEDSTMEALLQASQFDRNLYWCVRNGDAISENVKQLLDKHESCAFKVVIPSADEAMAQLFKQLTGSDQPQILSDPISLIIESTKDLNISGTEIKSTDNMFYNNYDTQVQDTLARLRLAQDIYLNPEKYKSIEKAGEIIEEAIVSKNLDDALKHARKGEFAKAMKLLNQAIDKPHVKTQQKATALFYRGLSYGQMQPPQTDKEIADYTAVIDMAEIPAQQKAVALFMRGVGYGQMQPPQTDKEIADYTAMIDMADVPAELRARALVKRGVSYGQMQLPQTDKEIADYTAVIDMADVPAELRAQALVKRGVGYGKMQPPQTDKEITDCTAVIDMADAPAEMKARALVNRGASYGQLQPPQTDKVIADCTAVIDMADAPAQLKAEALFNRGVSYGRLQPPQGDKEIADYAAVIEMADAPVELKANAYGNRGICYFKINNDAQQLLIDSNKALEHINHYAYRYNKGLACLFLGKSEDAKIFSIPAIKECGQISQIEEALELLIKKEDVLPTQSNEAYEAIIKVLKDRKKELES